MKVELTKKEGNKMKVELTKKEAKMILTLISYDQDQTCPWMQEDAELKIIESIEKKLSKK